MNQRLKSEICVVLAAVFWGMIGISVKALTRVGLSGVDVVFLRCFTAFVVLGAYLTVADRKALKIRFKDIWCFVGTGIFSLLLFNICYFNAMRYSTLSVAAVLLYTAPGFVVVLSALLFKEKITVSKTVALVVMFAGCTLVSGVFPLEKVISIKGLLFGIGSGFGYALYSIFGRYAINRGYSSQTVSFYTFAFASVGCLFCTDFSGIGAKMNISTLGYCVFLGVFCCILPYLLYTKGMQHTENGRASILAMIEPVVATLISIFVFWEPTDQYIIIGIVMMFAGIAIMNIKRKSKDER